MFSNGRVDGSDIASTLYPLLYIDLTAFQTNIVSRSDMEPVFFSSSSLDLRSRVQRPNIHGCSNVVSLPCAQLVELVSAPPKNVGAPVGIILRTLFRCVKIGD